MIELAQVALLNLAIHILDIGPIGRVYVVFDGDQFGQMGQVGQVPPGHRGTSLRRLCSRSESRSYLMRPKRYTMPALKPTLLWKVLPKVVPYQVGVTRKAIFGYRL